MHGVVQAAIEAWNPGARSVHCSNCRHCLVYGPPELPLVRCARGQGNGKEKLLVRLIASNYGRGWRTAAECPDFSSMSDAP